MYLLKGHIMPNGHYIINIVTFNRDDSWLKNYIFSVDIFLASLIHLSTSEYVDIISKEFNLKQGHYKSTYYNHNVFFTYAETPEQATLWKDWVESRMLMNNMLGE